MYIYIYIVYYNGSTKFVSLTILIVDLPQNLLFLCGNFTLNTHQGPFNW